MDGEGLSGAGGFESWAGEGPAGGSGSESRHEGSVGTGRAESQGGWFRVAVREGSFRSGWFRVPGRGGRRGEEGSDFPSHTNETRSTRTPRPRAHFKCLGTSTHTTSMTMPYTPSSGSTSALLSDVSVSRKSRVGGLSGVEPRSGGGHRPTRKPGPRIGGEGIKGLRLGLKEEVGT